MLLCKKESDSEPGDGFVRLVSDISILIFLQYFLSK